MQTKVAWYLTTDDIVAGAIVYAEEIARRLVAERDVVKVERVVTEWFGSHDDGTRSYTIIYREDVTGEFL